ncbi:MAG: FecR domain-containing protein [Bryobacteraceae bacterium]|nr:FecR domain-containing protein [Bryobacteraceae bacterium]
MMSWSRRGWLFCLAGSFLPQAYAQQVISARSGLIQYFERSVFLNEEPLERDPNRFAQMDRYDVLRTAGGRAEILISPEAFLRIRERSSVRLLSDSVVEPCYELLSGSMILEAQEMPRRGSVQILWRDFKATISKRAIFRLDSATGNLRVIEGEVNVLAGD